MTPEQAELIAAKLVSLHHEYGWASTPMGNGRFLFDCGSRERDERLRTFVDLLQGNIVAALLATNPPDGSVTLPGGSVVEVVGNLVVTGDGKVVGEGVMNLWSINGNQRTVRGPYHYEARVTGAHPFAWSELFTTRELAEAAAKEGR